MRPSRNNGYLAITTAVIITLVILVVAATTGSASLLTRFNDLGFYDKKTSFYLAQSCLDYALLQLAESSSYGGNETLNIGSDQCTLRAVSTVANTKVIKATGQFNGATTNLQYTVLTADLTALSLEEVTNF